MNLDLGLNDRTALVFGAGGGLGGAIARALAGEGAKVVVADINGEAAHTNAQGINAGGGTAKALAWDLADLSIIDSQMVLIEAGFGPVEVLVDNTGGPPPTPVAGQQPETWQQYFSSMVLPVIALIDRVLKDAKWGRIITSTSSGVVAPIPGLGLSKTLRSSLLGWSKTLSQAVGRYGIAANIVLPGRIATDRITFLDQQKAYREGRSVADVSTQSAAAIAVMRYGSPEEYGDTVAFLASTRASYITGSVIRVDGGLIPSV